MTDKHDIISLFESMIDEVEISSDAVMNSVSKISKEIDDRKIRAPEEERKRKKKQKTITSKKRSKDEDQNEEEETELDTKKSVPKDLQPKFVNPEEEEEEDNDINLEDAHDFYSFLDRLNLFRAAGSLKDSDVIDRLKRYFANLSPGAREAAFVIINSLTGIANLVVDGNSADLPSKFGISITHGSKSSRKKEEEKVDSGIDSRQYKISKEKVQKKVASKKSKNKNSDMNPISVVPESLQDKSEILKVLNELKS